MSAQVIRMKTLEGEEIAFIDEIKGQGTYKDCYLTPDGRDVVLWFREPIGEAQELRYAAIAGLYRQSLMQGEGGDYWGKLFCWPRALLRYQQRLGLVVPAYSAAFRFAHGAQDHDRLGLQGKEKESYWFLSLKHRAKTLDARELGDWRNHLRMALLVARATRRLHASGLAHGDLSYKNVLSDPTSGQICLIDLDGLIVPGKHAPEVVGTRDFIAPEVIKTQHLPREQRVLPGMATDLHALAVLIYQYLLLRHPLRGDAVHDADDDERNEQALMGTHALFVEDASAANAIRKDWLSDYELPWKDTAKLPYTVLGPWLAPLIQRAFGPGLHDPTQRPSAEEWEDALAETADYLIPCANPVCPAHWQVYDPSRSHCPFCDTARPAQVPVLHFYSARDGRSFAPENRLFVGYQHAGLYAWHADRYLRPNEKLKADQRLRGAYFVQQGGHCLIVNERFNLRQVTTSLDAATAIGQGQALQLENGCKLYFADTGRLAVVQGL